MAIIPRTPVTREVIDLTGPKGNAYYILGRAQNLSKQLELDAEAILEEMKESDYDNLIRVFDKYFGEYVDIILP